MSSQPNSWEAKYRSAGDRHGAAEPAPIVAELLPLLPQRTALDLACGAGRHALLLAARGYRVVGIDVSAAALQIAEERVRAAGIRVCRAKGIDRPKHASAAGLELVEADLETVQLPAESFDVILCVHYLQRSLFSQMERALRTGGMLVFETFTRAHLEFRESPRNPAFLLESYELRNAFPGLKTIFYRELRAGKGIASLLARKPA
jgi:tellurite methyltransferase